MLSKPAIRVNPVVQERFLKAVIGKGKQLRKLEQFTLRNADNFLEALGNGLRLIQERAPVTTYPEKLTLAEALKFREAQDSQRGLNLEEKTFLLKSGKGEKKFNETLEIRDILISLIEKVLSKIEKWNQEKAEEILVRSMASLIFCEEAEKGDLIEEVNKKLATISDSEREVYCTFPEGPWGKILAYPLSLENRDEIIFKILANLRGNEYPLVLTQNEAKSYFASYQEQRSYFSSLEARAVENKARTHRTRLLTGMEEAWDNIENYRAREISPGGWDKILVSASLGKLGIKYLRFIKDGIKPPAVGLEVELENGKVLLAKINNQGVLIAAWISDFPMVSWLINSAALFHLKNLTVGGDSYERYREERKTPGTKREVREYLVSQRERKYRYIPRSYLYSGDDREVRKIGQRKSPILHPVRGHKRDLPSGKKPSPEGVANLIKAGFVPIPGRTWIGGYFRGEDSGNEPSPKPIKDLSAAEEIEKLLGI